MYLFTHALFFPTLLVTSGALAQLTAEPTSSTPDVAYPSDCSFVFCSAQDCTGTCEVVNAYTVNDDVGHATPNDMGYESIYNYTPYNNCSITLYTCATWACGDAVAIGGNACYNLYDDGTLTPFTEYYFLPA